MGVRTTKIECEQRQTTANEAKWVRTSVIKHRGWLGVGGWMPVSAQQGIDMNEGGGEQVQQVWTTLAAPAAVAMAAAPPAPASPRRKRLRQHHWQWQWHHHHHHQQWQQQQLQQERDQQQERDRERQQELEMEWQRGAGLRAPTLPPGRERLGQRQQLDLGQQQGCDREQKQGLQPLSASPQQTTCPVPPLPPLHFFFSFSCLFLYFSVIYNI